MANKRGLFADISKALTEAVRRETSSAGRVNLIGVVALAVMSAPALATGHGSLLQAIVAIGVVLILCMAILGLLDRAGSQPRPITGPIIDVDAEEQEQLPQRRPPRSLPQSGHARPEGTGAKSAPKRKPKKRRRR